MLFNEKIRLTDKEIIEKGSRALIKELGYSGFLRFVRQVESSSKEDYLNIDKEIFKDMSLDDIFEGAKEHWEGREL